MPLSKVSKKQIQPRWPLTISPAEGPYKSVDSVRESIKQDFIFLLNTNPGEWPANPGLGVGLRRYLFENFNSLEVQSIRSNIKRQVQNYLPQIVLGKVGILSDAADIDTNVMVLLIQFSIDKDRQVENLVAKANLEQESFEILEMKSVLGTTEPLVSEISETLGVANSGRFIFSGQSFS